MAAVRASDTTPEVMLRRELWRRGLRYRKNDVRLTGKPDIVFSGHRVAVFVDGDFWHGRSWKTRGYASFEEQFVHRNGDWWRAKIEGNIARDRRVNRTLRSQGWRVLHVWESSIRKDVVRAADRVERFLASS
jgi:DNA mismatch endonuclease (patch repair protein)